MGQRRVLIYLLGYLSLASSLTANIYFPIVDLLSDRYEVSLQAINLTITLFVVFQGIAPSFWSPLSDSYGRRPVYLATFVVYTLASLGLAISDRSYPALLILRAMQSVGGSAVLSLSYAVVSDVCVHSERGRLIAPMMAATNIGPFIGPIIGGGAILATGDPRWCFRTLLIFGGSAALLIGFFMPETNRNVVGNGAVPAKGLWRTWWHIIGGKTGRGKMLIPNPLPSLRIVFYADTFLTLWLAASPYALWCCVQTSITPIYEQYGYNALEIGLCFLAGGAGIIAGGFVAGKLMDHNYQHVARGSGLRVDRVRGDDMARFPIEHARSRHSTRILLVSACAVAGYGWAVQMQAHAAAPLVLQFYMGCKCTTLHQTYSALIVDVFPDRPGTAAAANNITHCTLSAAAVAILNPLVGAIGYGWFFTLLALLDGISCIAAVWALRVWGMEWRNKRGRRDSSV
ncbi:major facilitator superfamily transporter [Xylariomycetidae sp. FL2044]|nr:major facilitator superfamily transporter [Xylariomycetidae sp. FL2044]